MGIFASARAQDPQFSQFYASPLYHNPAFTGGSLQNRLMLNYRNQWPSLPGSYNTFAASFDTWFSHRRSGVGAQVVSDQAGAGALRNLGAAGSYAYKINITKKWSVNAGFQAALWQRSLDMNNLVFGDQLNTEGEVRLSADPLSGRSLTRTYFDVNTGLVSYTRNWWVGVAIHHITKPNVSVIDDRFSYLDPRLTVSAGAKIALVHSRGLTSFDGGQYLYPVAMYRRQGNFDQFDLSAYYVHSPWMVGLGYRGYPVRSLEGFTQHDAAVVLIGMELDNIRFGYSYDVPLTAVASSLGGSHEISLGLYFGTPPVPKRKKRSKLDCPDIQIPAPEF